MNRGFSIAMLDCRRTRTSEDGNFASSTCLISWPSSLWLDFVGSFGSNKLRGWCHKKCQSAECSPRIWPYPVRIRWAFIVFVIVQPIIRPKINSSIGRADSRHKSWIGCPGPTLTLFWTIKGVNLSEKYVFSRGWFWLIKESVGSPHFL